MAGRNLNPGAKAWPCATEHQAFELIIGDEFAQRGDEFIHHFDIQNIVLRPIKGNPRHTVSFFNFKMLIFTHGCPFSLKIFSVWYLVFGVE